MIVQDDNFKASSPPLEAMNFGEDDLDANRDGYITKRQRVLIGMERGSWRIFNWIILFVAPIAVVLAIWDGIRIGDTLASRIGIVALICLVLGGFYIYCFRKSRQFDNDLAKGNVISIQGEIRLTSYRARNGKRYFAQVDATKFRVSKRAYLSLQLEPHWKLYFLPNSKTIISAEPVQ